MDNLESELNKIRKEISILQMLSHPNIIKYHYAEMSAEEKAVDILLEYIPGGSVRNLLDKFGPLDEKIIKIYIKQILEGLKYLHMKGIVHHNLKCSNILVANEGMIKLSDLLAIKRIVAGYNTKPIENTSDNTNRIVIPGYMMNSLYWMAPEVINNMEGGKPADIWSLGCVMYEMRTGKPPWLEFGKDPVKMLEGFPSDGPKLPKNCLTPLAESWLRRCFAKKPGDRPTVDELLNDPFIVKEDQSGDMQAMALVRKITSQMEIQMNSEIFPDDKKVSSIISINSPDSIYKEPLDTNKTKGSIEEKKSNNSKPPIYPVAPKPSERNEDEEREKERRRKKWEEALKQELEKKKINQI